MRGSVVTAGGFGAFFCGVVAGRWTAPQPEPAVAASEAVVVAPPARPARAGAAEEPSACDCRQECELTMALSGCVPAPPFPADLDARYQPPAVRAWVDRLAAECETFGAVYGGVDCDSYPCLVFLTLPEGADARFDEPSTLTCGADGPALQPGPSFTSGPTGTVTRALKVAPTDEGEGLSAELFQRVKAKVDELEGSPSN